MSVVYIGRKPALKSLASLMAKGQQLPRLPIRFDGCSVLCLPRDVRSAYAASLGMSPIDE